MDVLAYLFALHFIFRRMVPGLNTLQYIGERDLVMLVRAPLFSEVIKCVVDTDGVEPGREPVLWIGSESVDMLESFDKSLLHDVFSV